MIMNRTLIKYLKIDETQKIQGFLENFRNKRMIAFLVIRDTTGKVQVTVDKEAQPEFKDLLSLLTPGSVVTIEGLVSVNPHVKLNGIEILPKTINAESIAETIPLQKDSSIEARMDYRWLDLREERQQMIFKIQTCLTASLRRFLLERNFVEIHTPKLIGTASESGADVFEVKYFNRNAYLAQSPQFYKQMAMAGGMERIFEFGPVFRAEKSYTNRHSTEFTGFDLEFSYIDSYEDIMRMEEELLAYSLSSVKETYDDDIERLFNTTVMLPSLPFPVSSMLSYRSYSK
jgi:aspartyl-tRNA synthetase